MTLRIIPLLILTSFLLSSCTPQKIEPLQKTASKTGVQQEIKDPEILLESYGSGFSMVEIGTQKYIQYKGKRISIHPNELVRQGQNGETLISEYRGGILFITTTEGYQDGDRMVVGSTIYFTDPEFTNIKKIWGAKLDPKFRGDITAIKFSSDSLQVDYRDGTTRKNATLDLP